MVDGIKENIFLVNAPAGSGKTTKIRKMIEIHLRENPEDNILCITYTNIVFLVWNGTLIHLLMILLVVFSHIKQLLICIGKYIEKRFRCELKMVMVEKVLKKVMRDL